MVSHVLNDAQVTGARVADHEMDAAEATCLNSYRTEVNHRRLDAAQEMAACVARLTLFLWDQVVAPSSLFALLALHAPPGLPVLRQAQQAAREMAALALEVVLHCLSL